MQEMDSIFIFCTILFVTICIRVDTWLTKRTRAAMAQIQMSIPARRRFCIVFRIDALWLGGRCVSLAIFGLTTTLCLRRGRLAQGDVPGKFADAARRRSDGVYDFLRTVDDAIRDTLATTALCSLQDHGRTQHVALVPNRRHFPLAGPCGILCRVRTFGIFAGRDLQLLHV